MSKKRELVRLKFGGLCAYSGKPLDEKWQVDHIVPVSHWVWQQPGTTQKPNDMSNLLPAIRILNHYKRAKDLEAWRKYLLTLHIRLKKCPRNPFVEKSIKHKQYLMDVADLFGITIDKPFTGIFYFETLTPTNNNTNEGQ